MLPTSLYLSPSLSSYHDTDELPVDEHKRTSRPTLVGCHAEFASHRLLLLFYFYCRFVILPGRTDAQRSLLVKYFLCLKFRQQYGPSRLPGAHFWFNLMLVKVSLTNAHKSPHLSSIPLVPLSLYHLQLTSKSLFLSFSIGVCVLCVTGPLFWFVRLLVAYQP